MTDHTEELLKVPQLGAFIDWAWSLKERIAALEADNERLREEYDKACHHAGVNAESVAALIATPAQEVRQEAGLDERLTQAGMLSVAQLLKGAPLDAFIKHAGVHDLSTLLQWAEMRRGECLRMMARYDLGEKDKGDDLYEWTVAHCAVFTELHVNLRAALATTPQPGPDVRALVEALDDACEEFELRGLHDLKAYKALKKLHADIEDHLPAQQGA